MAYVVRNYIDSDKLKKDISYSLTDLSAAMQDQAALYAEYGVYLAKASKQVDLLESALEVLKARIYRDIRDKMKADGEKVVVSDIERDVTAHEKVVALKSLINEAKQIEATAKTAVKAFEQRRDMLIQHGATEREERKGELRMFDKTVRDAAAEATKNAVLEGQRKFNRSEA